jgi:hypothetical protein
VVTEYVANLVQSFLGVVVEDVANLVQSLLSWVILFGGWPFHRWGTRQAAPARGTGSSLVDDRAQAVEWRSTHELHIRVQNGHDVNIILTIENHLHVSDGKVGGDIHRVLDHYRLVV